MPFCRRGVAGEASAGSHLPTEDAELRVYHNYILSTRFTISLKDCTALEWRERRRSQAACSLLDLSRLSSTLFICVTLYFSLKGHKVFVWEERHRLQVAYVLEMVAQGCHFGTCFLHLLISVVRELCREGKVSHMLFSSCSRW